MLLVTLLTKKFIKSTCQKKNSDSLQISLESLFFLSNYQQVVILEPGLDFNKYISQLKTYDKIKSQRTMEWE